MSTKYTNEKEGPKKLHSISKLMNDDEIVDQKLKDEYDDDENSNLISKTLEDDENLDEQFDCCSSEDFTDDSNNYRNKSLSHSNQKKLIEVYSDNDLGSVNNTNSNRNSPDHCEDTRKRKLYDFYSENENNCDDDQEEGDEVNSENANEELLNLKDNEEYSEKHQGEILGVENKLDSNVDNKRSCSEGSSKRQGERIDGVHKKKKIPIRIENNNNDGSNQEREILKNSMNSNFTSKSDGNNTPEVPNSKQRSRNDFMTEQQENSSNPNFAKLISSSSSISPLATTLSVLQSSPSSISSSLGKLSPNNGSNEIKNSKKPKTNSSSLNGSFDNKQQPNHNNNNKSPKPSHVPLPSSASPFDNKMFSNSVPNIFGPHTPVPTLNPNDLTNFVPSQGMLPPFFDPELFRLASANHPLFRIPDFNPAYFSSLTNMFRASQQSQNIPLPNSNPFLDAVSSPLNSMSSQPFGSNINNIPSQKLNRVNHLHGSLSNDKKPDVSSLESKHQNGFNESPKIVNNNGFLDKSQIQKTNKNNGINTNITKKNETPSVLNGHTQISSQNANINSNSVNSNIPPSSSSPSSKLKFSKFSKLNSAEIQTIKTLINSYKESAAFLSRSAEELEQLIGESS